MLLSFLRAGILGTYYTPGLHSTEALPEVTMCVRQELCLLSWALRLA